MKNRFLSAAHLSFILSLLLVACQPTTNLTSNPTVPTATEQPAVTENTTPTLPPEERVKLRWFIGVGTGKTYEQLETARAFVKCYNDSQDKIELELEVVTVSTHTAIDQLMVEIEAGKPPDIVAPANMSWAGDQLTGHMLPLDDYLEGYDLSSVDTAELDSWRVDGKLMGLPSGDYSSVIFYNKHLFDKANLPYPPHKFGESYADGDPWTVEKMEALALQLTLDANGRNAADPDFDPASIIQWGFHWQWDSTRSMAVMFGAGEVVDANGNAVIPPRWREGFNWYYDGIWKKYFIPPAAKVNGAIMQGNPFFSGKVAMVHYYTFYSPRLISFPNWDMAAVPSYKGAVTTRLERDGLIILNTTQHPAEAFEVAYAIVTNPELLLAWEMLPAFKGLQASFLEQVKAKHPGVDWQVMLDSLKYADITYENTMPNYRKSYDRLLVFRDLMGTDGNLTLDTEIDKLESDLQMLFDEAP